VGKTNFEKGFERVAAARLMVLFGGSSGAVAGRLPDSVVSEGVAIRDPASAGAT